MSDIIQYKGLTWVKESELYSIIGQPYEIKHPQKYLVIKEYDHWGETESYIETSEILEYLERCKEYSDTIEELKSNIQTVYRK